MIVQSAVHYRALAGIYQAISAQKYLTEARYVNFVRFKHHSIFYLLLFEAVKIQKTFKLSGKDKLGWQLSINAPLLNKMYSLNNSANASKSTRSIKYNYRCQVHKPLEQEQINNFIRNKLQNEITSDSIYAEFINIVCQQLDKPTIIMAMYYVDKLRYLKLPNSDQFVFSSIEELCVCAFVIADFMINDNPYIYRIINQYNFDMRPLNRYFNYVIPQHPECLPCDQEDYLAYQQEFEASSV